MKRRLILIVLTLSLVAALWDRFYGFFIRHGDYPLQPTDRVQTTGASG